MRGELRVGADIANRLETLAARIMRIACMLPKEAAYRHMALQLARAATAGGANYEEARGAESRADFIHKVMLAVKETREATYWLRLARGAGLVARAIADPTIDEASQLTAILVASARTARRNAASL